MGCDNFVCKCGENNFDLLITIDGKPMCENCIQDLIDDLRGWGLMKLTSPTGKVFKLKVNNPRNNYEN